MAIDPAFRAMIVILQAIVSATTTAIATVAVTGEPGGMGRGGRKKQGGRDPACPFPSARPCAQLECCAGAPAP
eukprot:71703-Chlamydomonas_euryale.AAC.4